MKVYVIDGNCFVEVSKNYLLYICSQEEFDFLSVAEQLEKVRATLADFKFTQLDTSNLRVM